MTVSHRPSTARLPVPRGNGAPVDPSREKPWDLLLLCAAGLILVAVARVHSFFPVLDTIRPALLLTLLGTCALVLRHRGARSIKHLKSPIGYLIAFIFLWALLGVPFAIYQGNSARFLANSFLRTGVVVLLIAASVRNVPDLMRLLKVYALGAVAFSLLAQGTGGLRDIGGGGYDPNDSAMFIVSAIPLVIYFLFRAKSIPGKLLFGFGLLACGSAVVLTGSRGGFLALIAVLGFSLFFFKGIAPIVRTVAVAAVAVVVSVSATGEFWERMDTMFDEDDYNRHSVTGRQEIWTRGMGYMVDNPVLGVGINNFSVAEGRHPEIAAMIQRGRGVRYSAAHSVWVQAGAELGLPGFIAYLALLGLSIRFLWRLERQARFRPREPSLEALSEVGRPVIGVLVGLAVAGTFLSHAYSSLFWVGFALVLSVTKLSTLAFARITSNSLPQRTLPHAPAARPVGSTFSVPAPSRVQKGSVRLPRRG